MCDFSKNALIDAHVCNALLKAGKTSVWEWDAETDQVSCSPNLCELCDLRRGQEKPSRSEWLNIIHPADRQSVIFRIQDAIQDTSAECSEFTIDYRIIQRDGNIRWMNTRGLVRRDSSGRILGLGGISVDVTERKQSELALEFLGNASQVLASSLDFRKTLTATAQMAIPGFADWCAVDLLDDKGRLERIALIHASNEAVARAQAVFSRYPCQATDLYGLGEILRTGRVKFIREITDDILRRGTRDLAHYKDLSPFGLRSFISVPLFARGRVLGVLSFATAESRRIYTRQDLFLAEELGRRAAMAVDNAFLFKAETQNREAAKREHNLLSTVMKHMPAGVLIAEAPSGKLVMSNDQAARLLGHSFQVGETIDSYTHWALFSLDGRRLEVANWPMIRTITSGETITNEELFIRRADGSLGTFSVSSAPIRNATGDVTAAICIFHDISERQQAARDLELAKDMAVAANQAKNIFLANMSHEIRTPLGVIVGHADLLVHQESSETEKRNSISAIRRNSALLTRLIDDLLDLSKIEAGKVEIEHVDVSLAQVVRHVVSIMEIKAQEKSLTLSFRNIGPIPERINTDPLRLKQILINVIGNAIKFSERGSVRVTIQHVGDSLEFEVQDSGVGIPAHRLSALFQPFSQIDDAPTRKFGGSGLGLALSRKLAIAMGGNVWLVGSVPGRGSTFKIRIGVGNTSGRRFIHTLDLLETEHREEPAQTPPKKHKPLTGMRLLLVEDSRDNQLLISRILKLAGAEVEIADDGAIGVEKALQNNYDLVLMDIQMPRLDGYQATRKLRALGYTRPILALTAHAYREERDRCVAAGCNDHLTKPVHRTALIDKLAAYRSDERRQ